MFQCAQCGRHTFHEILRCATRDGRNCAFTVRNEPLFAERRAAGASLLAGAVIIFVSAYSPLFRVGIENDSIFGILARISLFTLCLLLGLYILVRGALVYLSRRLTLYSRAQEKSWESFRLRGREYRVRMVADLERIPANLAAGIKHESVGFTPFERALFELLSRGMVELRRAGVYESCGKQIEFTTHRRKLLVWTASTEEEQPVSKLAEKIFNLVRNWPEAELSREEVLGPTIGLLWRSLKSELEPDSQLAEGGSVDAAKEAWSSLFPQHPEIASELCKDLAKVGSRGQLKHRKIRWRPFLVFP